MRIDTEFTRKPLSIRTNFLPLTLQIDHMDGSHARKIKRSQIASSLGSLQFEHL